MEQANSIEKFMQILGRYSAYNNLYFLGQSEKYKTIPPSITRDDGYIENESRIYYEALDMASNDFTGLTLPIEKLAKMQHYMIPTRLIDVTIDPLIALFFAIQNTQSEHGGNIYVYLPTEYDLDSRESKALSLLAIKDDKSIIDLCKSFFKEYGEIISEEDMETSIAKPIFIKHCQRLQRSNNRLFNQKGAFVICSNQVQNNRVCPELITLDSIIPVMTIRIPYEYKAIIKNELDEKHKISEPTVFPELSSVGNYILKKYKKENVAIDGTYSIIEEKNNSTLAAKRISIIITLSKILTIAQIKSVAFEATKQYQKLYDIVWVYIAKNGDDYIMRNWVFQAQWISPTLNEKYRPLIYKNSDDGEYFYEENESYSAKADYYAKNIFKDDKLLYICHKKILDIIYPAYLELTHASEHDNLARFKSAVNKNYKILNDAYFKINDLGHSRNAVFDQYLYLFDYAISSLDDMHLFCESNNLSEPKLLYQLVRCLKDASKHFETILSQNEHWESEFHVTLEDYENISIDSAKRDEYQYSPTLPISENAIDVKFDVTVSFCDTNTFCVSGKTNLFDGASLMMSIYDKDGNCHSHGKATITDGHFEYPLIAMKENKYQAGRCEGKIFLPIPSVEPKDFVAKAGIEYENLKGDFVDRAGIGPTGEYVFTFEIGN